jgi:hypothetical protein
VRRAVHDAVPDDVRLWEVFRRTQRLLDELQQPAADASAQVPSLVGLPGRAGAHVQHP